MAERRWRIRLGAAAEVDFANILKWTTENFGARQSRLSEHAPSGDWRTRRRSRCRRLQSPRRGRVRCSHPPRRATMSSRKSLSDVPGSAKQHDRNRAYPPRQNGPSTPRSICARREHQIELPVAWPRKPAPIWIRLACSGASGATLFDFARGRRRSARRRRIKPPIAAPRNLLPVVSVYQSKGRTTTTLWPIAVQGR
jgi:hypothetical protein